MSKCKYEDYGSETVASYDAKKNTERLKGILVSFNAEAWRHAYRGDHGMQAYRRKFFRLARNRGIRP